MYWRSSYKVLNIYPAYSLLPWKAAKVMVHFQERVCRMSSLRSLCFVSRDWAAQHYRSPVRCAWILFLRIWMWAEHRRMEATQEETQGRASYWQQLKYGALRKRGKKRHLFHFHTGRLRCYWNYFSFFVMLLIYNFLSDLTQVCSFFNKRSPTWYTRLHFHAS